MSIALWSCAKFWLAQFIQFGLNASFSTFSHTLVACVSPHRIHFGFPLQCVAQWPNSTRFQCVDSFWWFYYGSREISVARYYTRTYRNLFFFNFFSYAPKRHSFIHGLGPTVFKVALRNQAQISHSFFFQISHPRNSWTICIFIFIPSSMHFFHSIYVSSAYLTYIFIHIHITIPRCYMDRWS